jgi:PAS domain S-box-containing protein
MKPDSQYDKLIRGGTQICAVAACGIAALAGLSWAFDSWRSPALGADHVPMAPSTSLLLILISVAVFLRSRWPAQQFTKAIAVFAAVAGGVSSVLIGSRYIFCFQWTLESWLAPRVETMSGVPVNRMAALSAPTFLLATVSLLLQLPPFDRRRLLQHVGAGLALTVLLIGIVVVLGYAFDATVLYGVTRKPMALLTASAFILLSLGLLLGSGAVTSGLKSLIRSVPSRTDKLLPAFPWLLLALLLVLTTAIGASGFFVIKRQLTDSRRRIEDELAAIAELKVGQIAHWREERFADANAVLDSGDIADDFQQLLANPANTQAKNRVLDAMGALRRHNRYARVLLLDANQQVQFSVPSDKDWLGSIAKTFVARAVHGSEVMVSDLHISPAVPGYVNMDLFVPLLPPSAESRTARKPIGVLMLDIDPAYYLFPLIQSWPTPSVTAETLLVRREGDSVLFLNELRHQADTALRLRLPMDRPNLPAAMAALGQEKVVAGIDYRNVPVLAATHPIPDSPWFLVAKVDQEEVYAPLRRQLLISGSLFGVLLLATMFGVGLLWRQRDTAFLRQALAQEKQREALANRIAHLTKHANDIILLADQDWRILEANDRGLEAYGYTLAELQRMTLRDLRSPEAREAFERQTGSEDAMKGTIYETMHQRKNGSHFPVESSLRAVDLAGTTYRQCILRDVTERKQAEEALQRERAFVRAVFDSVPGIIYVYDAEGHPVRWNKRIEEISGFSNEELANRNAISWFRGDEVSHVAAMVEQVFTDGHADTEATIFTKDGHAIPFYLTGVRLTFDDKRYLAGIGIDITDRKRAENALAESESRLNAILQGLPVPSFVIDGNHRVTHWNRALENYSGIKAKDIIGTNQHWRAFYPTERPCMADLQVDGMEARIPVWYAGKCVPSTLIENAYEVTDFFPRMGSLGAWLWFTCAPITGPDGKVVAAIETFVDITERKQAQEKLRQSEEKYELERRYHAVLDQTFAFISLLTPDGTLIESNRVALEAAGVELSDVVGKPYWEMPWWGQSAELQDHLRKAIQAAALGEVVRFEATHLSAADGDVRYDDGSIKPVRNERGEIVLLISEGRDVTEIKRAEERLRASEYRYRTLYESSRDAIMMLTPEKGFLAGNPATLAMFECKTEAEFTHYTPADLSPERQPDGSLSSTKAQEMMAIAMREGSHFFEWTHKRADGAEFPATVLLTRMNLRDQTILQATVRDVTEQRRSEEDRREFEGRFRDIIDNSGAGVIFVDADTAAIVSANQAMAIMLGRSAEELRGMSIFAMHPPEAFDRISHEFEEHRAASRHASSGIPILRKDGSCLYADVTSTAVTLNGVRYLGVFFYDATERTRAEEALRESEKRYRTLFESAAEGLLIADAETRRFQHANAALCRMLGYSENELKRMSVPDIHPKDAVEHVLSLFERMVTHVLSSAQALPCLRKDGTTIYADVSASGIVINGRKCVVGFFNDVTDRKQAVEALQQSQRRLRSLIDGVGPNMFIGLLTPDGTLLETNRPSREVAGLKLEELLGTPFEENYWWNYSEEVKHQLRVAIERAARGEASRYDVQIRVAENQFAILDFSLQPLRDERGEIVFLVPSANVITERKQAEEALRRAHDELEQRVEDRTAQLAAKNEELKGFAYTVSHDLKAPLRGIAGYANELDRKHRAGLSERAHFCANQILTATHSLDHLIEDLLHYSRLDAETPSDTDLNLRSMIEAILRDRSSLIAEQHTEVTLDVPVATLRTWERGLAEVLTNLIDNALKYSRKAEPPRLTIRAEELEQSWRIAVSDNGIGFDMKYHDRIFGLFNRLVREEEFEGTGAGLAIVKKMVDKEGGRVWAESAPNQGATFFVEIPKTHPREQQASPHWQAS